MKLNLSCKKINIKDLLMCNYNLSKTEYEVLNILLKKNKGTSVKELSKKLDKQRSTIQKIVLSLLEKKIITKKQINLDRGYMYVYYTKEKENMISEIEENIKKFTDNLLQTLDKWKK